MIFQFFIFVTSCHFILGFRSSNPFFNQPTFDFTVSNYRNELSEKFGGTNFFQAVSTQLLISLSLLSISYFPSDVKAEPNELFRLKKGLRELDYLLENWEQKTTYCNFGEFQRELLDPKNKDRLMEAAAKGGLLDFDKSDTMIVKCRRDPQVVRAFLGLSTENPTLSKADDLMKKSSTLQLIDPDDFEEYMQSVDSFSQAIANVDALSYNARSDYSSQETFVKGQQDVLQNSKGNDYLEQSRKSVVDVADSLRKVVGILHL